MDDFQFHPLVYFIFGECIVLLIGCAVMLTLVLKGRLHLSLVMRRYALGQLGLSIISIVARFARYLYPIIDNAVNWDTRVFSILTLFDYSAFITLILVVTLFQINILQVFIVLSYRLTDWHMNCLRWFFIGVYPFVLVPCLLYFGSFHTTPYFIYVVTLADNR